MFRNVIVWGVAGMCFIGSSAFSQTPEEGQPMVEPAKATHDVSVTISPVHLVYGLVELTGEKRISDKFGAAAIVGGGVYEGIPLYELGLQARGYPIGSFDHGMQAGLELLWAHGRVRTDGALVTANALSVAPFLGYKLAMNVGFTVDMQAGYALTSSSARATSTDGTRTAAIAGRPTSGLLLNLNVGWSF